MFWGDKDTSISFCEDKYVNSKYIAEYYNTYSGLSYCLVGLYFYNNKIKDILIKGFMHIVIPIMTSHQPNMGTKVFGFSNQ